MCKDSANEWNNKRNTDVINRILQENEQIS